MLRTARPPKLLIVMTSLWPVAVAVAGISMRPWKLASWDVPVDAAVAVEVCVDPACELVELVADPAMVVVRGVLQVVGVVE